MNELKATGNEIHGGTYWREFAEKEYAALEGRGADEIKAEAHSIQFTMIHDYVRLAVRVVKLEQMGEDIRFMNVGKMYWLRLLADNKILPETLHHFCDRPLLMDAAAKLPICDQERLVKDEELPMVTYENGQKQTALVRPSRLSSISDIRLLFDRNHIRDEGEQVQWLRSKEPLKQAAEVLPEPLPYDVQKKVLVINRPVRLTKKQLANIMKLME